MSSNDRGLKLLFGALLAVLVLSALVGASVIGPGLMWPGMMWGYGSGGAAPIAGSWGISMALGMLAMLAFWVALIAGVVLLLRWALGQVAAPTASTGTDDPVAILRRRYAAGEIDQAPYERIRAELAA
jgi:putative membrane protein